MSAQPHTLFISYAHENEAFVNRFRADLTRNHIAHWVDKVGLKWGTPDWEEAIRNALAQASLVLYIASPDARKSDYVRDEIKIARELLGKPVHAIWAEGEHWLDCVPLGFGTQQYADLRGDAYEQGLQDVLAILTADASVNSNSNSNSNTQLDAPIHNPYIGLRAFERDDRADFFGRDVFIARLIEALVTQPPNQRLLGIVGPSGSGKSSVVMAGLLPQLMDGAVPAQGSTKSSATWRYLDPIKPGTQPIENLAIALKRELPDSISAIREDLDHRACRGLHQLAKRLVRPGERLVLFIDQFEETFTNLTSSNEAERAQFIHLLTTAAAEPDGVVQIILTLRADFYDRPMKYAELNRLLDARGQSVPTMSVSDLIDAVNKPAARAGLRFEDGLMGDIVFSVRDRIGALPLLQFALEQLAEDAVRHHSRSLSRAAYTQMGGVQGALARHAQQQFEKPQLPNDEVLGQAEKERLAHALFRRLVLPGNTEQDVARRRAPLSELSLTDPEDTRKLRALAEAFVRARLLTASAEPEQTEPDYEVSHEALLREWPWLSDWIAQNRADIALHHTLSDDVRGWRAHPRDGSYVYSGGRLVALNAFATLHRAEMTPDELAFWAASQKHETRLRSTRRLAWLAVPALLAVALMAGLLWFANSQRQLAVAASAEAERQRDVSNLLRGSVAGALVDRFPVSSTVQVLHVLSKAPPGSEVISETLRMADGNLQRGLVARLPGSVTALYPILSSTLLLVNYADYPAQILDQADGHLVATLSGPLADWNFADDGKSALLDYAGDDVRAELVRLDVSPPLTVPLSGQIVRWSVADDGKSALLDYAGDDVRAELLRLDVSPPLTVPLSGKLVSWDFVDDGKNALLVYAGDDVRAELLRLDVSPPLTVPLSGQIDKWRFAADGKNALLVYAGDDVRDELLRLDVSPPLTVPLSGQIASWDFADDGKSALLVYAGDDVRDELVRLDVSPPLTVPLSGPLADWNFAADGKSALLVVYAGADVRAELLRLDVSPPLTVPLSGLLASWDFADDGKSALLVYAGDDVHDELLQLDVSPPLTVPLSGQIDKWRFAADGKNALLVYAGDDVRDELLRLDVSPPLTVPLSGQIASWEFADDGKSALLDYAGDDVRDELVRLDVSPPLTVPLSGQIVRWSVADDGKSALLVYAGDDVHDELLRLDVSPPLTVPLSGPLASWRFAADAKSALLWYGAARDGEWIEFTPAGVLSRSIALPSAPASMMYDLTQRYLLIRFSDGRTQLWEKTAPQATLLADLSYGVTANDESNKVIGSFFDPQSHSLWVRYADGRTYLYSLDWLSATRGGRLLVTMPTQQVVSLACQYLLPPPLFDRAAIDAYLNEEFTACEQR